MNKIKNNNLNIIKLNNKIFIPFKIHQLPKYYNKNLEQFNLKGYIYISLNSTVITAFLPIRDFLITNLLLFNFILFILVIHCLLYYPLSIVFSL